VGCIIAISGEQSDDACANLLVYGCGEFSGPTALSAKNFSGATGEPTEPLTVTTSSDRGAAVSLDFDLVGL
jgi:hypothetical protein